MEFLLYGHHAYCGCTDKLINQQFHRDPSFDLRQCCFLALKQSLDSKKQKFITHAINGVHVSTLKVFKELSEVKGFLFSV